ncbi:apolipoprotein L3-like [Phyllobates terribilis]|uniref:apolipoprotein L3-like n=1 Tax=Phyllobates terribilis TaxID=111132 RepID=UPI003CCB65A9
MAGDQDNNMDLLNDSIENLKGILTDLLNTIADCSTKLLTIADDLDEFHKGATIASVTGSSVGIAGGITTIVGLILAPFTAGASLIVSGIGAGVAAVGGITGASASIADSVNMKNKCSQVDEIVKAINAEMDDLEKASKELDSLVNEIMSTQKVGDIPNSVRVGGRGVYAALEVVRLIQLGKVSAAAARGVQIAAQGVRVFKGISGVLAGLFIFIDIFFVAKGAVDIHRGSKTEQAAQIRECAEEIKKLHQDLQKLDEDLVPDNNTK